MIQSFKFIILILLISLIVACNPLSPTNQNSTLPESYNPYKTATSYTPLVLGSFSFTATSAGNTQSTLTWSSSSNATRYDLSWGTVSGLYTTGTATNVTSPYTVTGLANGTTYYFFVEASNGNISKYISNEATSTPVNTAPTSPTSFSGTSSVTNVVDLIWGSSSGASITYSVMRSNTSGSGYASIITGLTATTYSAASTNGTNYYYIVRATNTDGSSDSSEIVVKSIDNFNINTPISISSAQATLIWPAVVGADDYLVKYRTGAGAYSTFGTATTATTMTVTGLTNGTAYNFIVVANNTNNGSMTSSNNPSATPVAAPTAASSVTASSSTSGDIDINWVASTGTGTITYSILRSTTSGSGYTTLTSSLTSTTSYSDTTTIDGTLYYYVVRATNAGGSTDSSEVNAKSIASFSINTPISISSAQATLVWAAATGATNYQVKYRTGAGAYTNFGATTTSTSATVTGLTNGTTYNFLITASNANNGTLDSSNNPSATPVAAPTAASSVTASSSSTSNIDLNWVASTGTGTITYSILRSTTSGSGYTTLTSSLTGTTTYSDSSVTNGTLYYYVVRATNAGGSTDSSEVNAKSIASFSLDTPTSGNAQVSLVWAAATGATNYQVKYRTGAGAYTNFGATTTSTAATVTGLTNGTTYNFLITASNANNGTLDSSNNPSSTPIVVASAPSSVTATSTSANTIDLNWAASSGTATITYSVLRSTTSGSGYSSVTSSLTGTSYSDTSGLNGTLYYYVIRATNGGGSNDSSEVSAKSINNFSISTTTASDSQVSLTWGSATGATNYQVKYRTGAGAYSNFGTATTALTATVTGLTNNTAYNFLVSASNSNNGSMNSSNNPSATPGAAISAFSMDKVTTCNGTIKINWTLPSEATSYVVSWGTSSGTYSSTTATTTSPYTITGLTSGTKYYLMVTAQNSVNSRNASSELSATASCLIEKIASTPAVALGMRKLTSTYAGPLIKVRRSSDNAEQDIYPTTSGELDTTDLLTFTGASSGYVKTWYDQSGNAYDVSETTTANQPRIVNAGTLDTIETSKAGIYFNGAITTGLSKTNTGQFDQTNYDAASLQKTSASAASGTITRHTIWAIGDTNTSNTRFTQYTSTNTAGTYRIGRIGVSAQEAISANLGTSPIGTTYQQHLVMNPANVSEFIYRNGTHVAISSGTGTVATSVTNKLFQVGRIGITDRSTIGYISELMIWFSNTGTTIRQKIEGDQMWDIGKASTLPGGHPYQTTPP